MATFLKPEPEGSREEEVSDGVRYHRMYRIPAGTSLSSANLSRGNILDDVSYAEIISADRVPDRYRDGVADRPLVRVVAFLTDLWPGVSRDDELRELRQSRIQTSGPRRIQYVRRFEVEYSNIRESASGWTLATERFFGGTDASDYGIVYPAGVWTNAVVPKIARVHVTPKWTILKALVEAFYTAPRSILDMPQP